MAETKEAQSREFVRDAPQAQRPMEAWQDHACRDGILVFDGTPPPFAGKALEELYESLYSSLPYMEVFDSLEGASTYVSLQDGMPAAVLVFRHAHHEIAVVNEVFQLSADEMARFAAFVFKTYPAARKVSFNAVSCDQPPAGHALQCFPGTHYTIVPLPGTEKEYTDSLGKSTRKTIQYRLNRLRRDFPSFRHEVLEGDDIPEEAVLAVLDFNRMRMAEKQRVVDRDPDAAARILNLARRCGFVSLIRMDGRICAGTIVYRAGASVMSHINAHDPHYNDYRLGTLSCYLMICESIRRKAKEVNLQWGGEEYKYALLGVDHAYVRMQIYRSYLHLLSDAKNILQRKAGIRAHAARLWLSGQAKKDTPLSYCLRSCISLAKRKRYAGQAQHRP